LEETRESFEQWDQWKFDMRLDKLLYEESPTGNAVRVPMILVGSQAREKYQRALCWFRLKWKEGAFRW
jgi:hypothetical protein